MKNIENIARIAVSMVCLILLGFSFGVRAYQNFDRRDEIIAEEVIKDQVREKKSYAVTDNQGIRNAQCGYIVILKDRMYVSYTKHSCVDVYSLDGLFVYSIHLPDSANGGITMCSENEKLYIFGKDGTLYVLEGEKKINVLARDEATAQGYTSQWCRKNINEVIHITKTQITLHDGQKELTIKTPEVVADTMPLIMVDKKTEIFIVVAGILFFIGVFVMLLVWNVRRFRGIPKVSLINEKSIGT